MGFLRKLFAPEASRVDTLMDKAKGLKRRSSISAYEVDRLHDELEAAFEAAKERRRVAVAQGHPLATYAKKYGDMEIAETIVGLLMLNAALEASGGQMTPTVHVILTDL